MKLGLVASNGGHLAHLLWLRSWWSGHERVWVTFDTPDARAALAGERVVWAHHPTNRHLGNLARNVALARRVVPEEAADAWVSTGGGVAVPFLGVAALLGTPTVFVDVYDRVAAPSLSARLLAPIVDEVVLQSADAQRVLGTGVAWEPIR